MIERSADFQTPKWVCDYMVSLIPEKAQTILEPTPGQGNLVAALRSYDVTAPVDFWRVSGHWDCTVMNPPFSPMKKGYKILYACMDMSSNIIALMPWLVLINSEKRTRKIFHYGLRAVIHLPRSAFPGARVQCCILEMGQGFRGKTEFKFLWNPLSFDPFLTRISLAYT